MSSKLLGSIAACALVALLSAGCTAHVAVRYAPPPERTETVSPAPSAQHFWVKGHWQHNGDQYVWVSGHWETRRTHQIWAPGHWRQTAGGYVWVEGRWVTR